MRINLQRRLLLFLLTLCTVFSLAACNGGSATGDGSSDSGSGTETDPETAVQDIGLTLVENGKSEFVIVYSENASADFMATVYELQDAIKAYTGAKLKVKDDFLGHSDTENVYEILLGETNRAESQAVMDTLRSGEYVMEMRGTKLILCGSAENSTASAVRYFIREVLKTGEGLFDGCENGSLTFLSSQAYKKEGSYPLGSLAINGTPITECSIVIPKDATIELAMANLLRYHIRIYTGVNLSVVSEDDYSGKCAVFMGKTKQTTVSAETGKFRAEVTANGIEVVSNNAFGYVEAYLELTERFFSASGMAAGLNTGFSYVGDDNAADDVEKKGQLRIMYHNIWGTLNDYERSYLGDRNYYALALYQTYKPDILCMEEAHKQYRAEDKVLFEWLNREYVEIKPYISNPIFYNPDVLDLVESGYTKVNNTDTGSTWAVFRYRETGEQFAVINVHYPSNWGSTSAEHANTRRVLDAQTSVKAIDSLTEKYPGITIFHGGDYNAAAGTEPYNVMYYSGKLTNVRNVSSDVTRWGTMHPKPQYIDGEDIFSLNLEANYALETAIDHIMYRSETATIHRYHVLANVLAQNAADHSAHFVDVTLS